MVTQPTICGPDDLVYRSGPISKHLGICTRTFFARAARGEIPGLVKIGGIWALSRERYRRAIEARLDAAADRAA
jgi:ribosomal protein S14